MQSVIEARELTIERDIWLNIDAKEFLMNWFWTKIICEYNCMDLESTILSTQIKLLNYVLIV